MLGRGGSELAHDRVANHTQIKREEWWERKCGFLFSGLESHLLEAAMLILTTTEGVVVPPYLMHTMFHVPCIPCFP